MWPQLGPFGNHDGIDVCDLPISSFEILPRLTQKYEAGDASPLFIGVREMSANIAERGRAEKRITDRMTQHVAIRMAHRAFFERHFGPAYHQFSILGQPVQVIANS